jgi:hypothetical protein
MPAKRAAAAEVVAAAAAAAVAVAVVEVLRHPQPIVKSRWVAWLQIPLIKAWNCQTLGTSLSQMLSRLNRAGLKLTPKWWLSLGPEKSTQPPH